MRRKYNYFYKITNNINNKYYFGVHSTDNLEDGYMGSGKRLRIAYKKYGIENFTKEILKEFDSYLEALEYESDIVTEKLVNDYNCYNMKIGGSGGNKWVYENTKGKVVIKDKNTNTFIKVKTDSEYYNDSNNYEHLRKNKVVVFDKSGNTFTVNKDDDNYINGTLVYIHKNKITVKDDKENFYRIDVNDDRYKSGRLKSIWCNKKHKEETKNKMSKTHKLKGNHKGNKNSQFGTCWITKNNENKKIKNYDLDIWIQQGWIKGRILN
jgi:hypothetical protein